GRNQLRKRSGSEEVPGPVSSLLYPLFRSSASPLTRASHKLPKSGLFCLRECALVDQPSAQDRLSARALPARGLVLAAAMMAIVLTATEGSIVATAMPTIVADLGGFHLFSWAFAAFLLPQAVSIPIYGRLADLYGRKPV